jgi:hypothetical protein
LEIEPGASGRDMREGEGAPIDVQLLSRFQLSDVNAEAPNVASED